MGIFLYQGLIKTEGVLIDRGGVEPLNIQIYLGNPNFPYPTHELTVKKNIIRQYLNRQRKTRKLLSKRWYTRLDVYMLGL